MDYSTYEIEAKVEATHWWFMGRRRLFGSIIKKFGLLDNVNILDIGTSTGTNLRMLRELGFRNIKGLDLHDAAIQWCAEKKLGHVHKGDICNMPFPSNVFELILATDIIEHVDNDTTALTEIERVMKRGGRAIITVPAFQSLWGLQDIVSHHKRRYRKSDLICKLKTSGLVMDEVFYFNYLLFLPIWFVRQIIRI